jgi:site-specific recombinase XerD
MRVCGLKYYFRHIVLRQDLVVSIPNPRIQKYQTEVLTIDELKKLFNCCRDMRQVLIPHLMYDSGIRVRELIRLRPGDFDKHYKSIAIRNSKGQKTRVLKYGDRLRDTLNKYCRVMGGVPSNTLIESYKEKGSPLSLGGVQHIVKEIVKRSGIKKTRAPAHFPTYFCHTLSQSWWFII